MEKGKAYVTIGLDVFELSAEDYKTLRLRMQSRVLDNDGKLNILTVGFQRNPDVTTFPEGNAMIFKKSKYAEDWREQEHLRDVSFIRKHGKLVRTLDMVMLR